MGENIFAVVFFSLLLALAVSVSLVLITDYQIARGHYILEVREEYGLVAFANSSQLSGSYFLLGGNVQTYPVYHVMRQNADGGVWQSTIPAGPHTLIYETSDCIPHITVNNKRSTQWPYLTGHVRIYKVYIPEGSIWSGYDVDIREN